MRLSTTTRPGRARVREGLEKESPVIKFVGVRVEVAHKDEFIDSRPARAVPKRRFRLEGEERHSHLLYDFYNQAYESISFGFFFFLVC